MERRDNASHGGQQDARSRSCSLPAKQNLFHGDSPTSGDHQTVAEEQLQLLLKRQLSKRVSLEDELQQKKSRFSSEAVLKDNYTSRAGFQTLESFKQLSNVENKKTDLLEKGLTDAEIKLKLPEQRAKPDEGSTVATFGKSEVGTKDALAAIDTKFKERASLVRTPDVFSITHRMNRREMEIEQSHFRGTDKSEQLKHLVAMKQAEYPSDDPVIQTLKDFDETYSKKLEACDSDDDDDEKAFIGPVLAHVNRRVTPLDESIIKRNCLSLDHIKDIPKFANYAAGMPSNVLYLKNLSKKTAKEDLARLFCRYDNRSNPVMEYRVLNGRMKEQAFVTFPDVDCAEKALQLANGFVLHGKPIVIQFAKGKAGGKK